jgi:hypothetical protein
METRLSTLWYLPGIAIICQFQTSEFSVIFLTDMLGQDICSVHADSTLKTSILEMDLWWHLNLFSCSVPWPVALLWYCSLSSIFFKCMRPVSSTVNWKRARCSGTLYGGVWHYGECFPSPPECRMHHIFPQSPVL